jgi:hypothetical protein
MSNLNFDVHSVSPKIEHVTSVQLPTINTTTSILTDSSRQSLSTSSLFESKTSFSSSVPNHSFAFGSTTSVSGSVDGTTTDDKTDSTSLEGSSKALRKNTDLFSTL